MYQRDVPKIRRLVESEGPKRLVDVITFVSLTIRTPFSRVLGQAEEVSLAGPNAKCLWGSKKQTYLEAIQKADSLYTSVVSRRPPEDEALAALLGVHGLGLPKAGFVAQCLGYNVACLDVHNLRRMGLPVSITKLKSPPSKSISAYLSAVQDKGSEWYWDSWCEYVANSRYNVDLPTADSVSSYHYKCIKQLKETTYA